MKSPNDCLEELMDDDQIYMETFTNLVDERLSAALVKSLCTATGERSVLLFGKEIRFAIMNKLHERANNMSQASVTPLDNDTNIADLKREM